MGASAGYGGTASYDGKVTKPAQWQKAVHQSTETVSPAAEKTAAVKHRERRSEELERVEKQLSALPIQDNTSIGTTLSRSGLLSRYLELKMGYRKTRIGSQND